MSKKSPRSATKENWCHIFCYGLGLDLAPPFVMDDHRSGENHEIYCFLFLACKKILEVQWFQSSWQKQTKKMSIKMSSVADVIFLCGNLSLMFRKFRYFCFTCDIRFASNAAPEIDDFNMIVSVFFMFRICNRCTVLKLIETKNPLLCTTKRKPWRCHLHWASHF